MIKKRVFLLVSCLIICLSACSIGGGSNKSLAGVYKMSPGIVSIATFTDLYGSDELILAKDGTAKVTDSEGDQSLYFTWSYENGKLFMSDLLPITVSADVTIGEKFTTLKINYDSLSDVEFILEKTDSAPKTISGSNTTGSTGRAKDANKSGFDNQDKTNTQNNTGNQQSQAPEPVNNQTPDTSSGTTNQQPQDPAPVNNQPANTSDGQNAGNTKSPTNGNVYNLIAGTYEAWGTTFILAKDGTMRAIQLGSVILGSYTADEKTLELVMADLQSAKYNYSIVNGDLVVYENGSSTGTVFKKTAAAQNTAGIKENRVKKLNGIYTNSGNMYVFREDGQYRYSDYSSTSKGTYTIEGNSLLLKSDSGNAEYRIEMDNGLILYSAPVYGTLYTDVTSSYSAKEEAYTAAVSLFNSGRYSEAADKFKSISGYFDSKTMANEAAYQYGKQLYSAGSYDEALEVFSTLGNYSDSKNMIDLCYQVIDARNIDKFDIVITGKKSTVYESLGSYYNAVFKFDAQFINYGTENVSALAGRMTVSDYAGTLLFIADIGGRLSVPSGQNVEGTLTVTFKDFQDVVPNVYWAHLMDLENYTIDFSITSMTFNGRKVETVEWDRRLQEASASPYSTDITGVYEYVSPGSLFAGINASESVSIYCYAFGEDGSFTLYDYNKYVHPISKAEDIVLNEYKGTYSISGDEIHITITESADAWKKEAIEKYQYFKIINGQLVLYYLNEYYNPNTLICDKIMTRMDALNPALL